MSMEDMAVGTIEFAQAPFKETEIRIKRYQMIDHLNQVTNIILSSYPQSNDRNNLLDEIKKLKELANNL